MADIARQNRQYMYRAVRYLAAEAGINQFLDLGSGLPTDNNVHQIAQKFQPEARVLYVDNDPMVLAHGQALLADNANTTVITADMTQPEQILENPEAHRLIDSTPLPCAASRETVNRSELAGQAGYGYCRSRSRSRSRFFWGYRLYLVTTAEGMPITWCLAHPKIGEREVMTALLERDHHLVRAGQVILADTGLAGRDFKRFVSERLGCHLVRPDRKDEKPRHGKLVRSRQWTARQ